MKAVNDRSLFTTICDTIDKVSNDEIEAYQANSISSLCLAAHKLYDYELKRAIAEAHPEFGQKVTDNLARRNIESKPFDVLK